MVNPFLTPVGGSRRQFTNQFMQPQNQYDFSGWGNRLSKIEEGIAGLTEQFNDFQTPGDVEPEYQGNAAPEPLEQTANETGIESLVAEPAPHMRTTAINEGRAAGIGFATDPAPPGTVQLGAPTPTTPMGGQSLTRRGPLSLTEKLQNEYLMETKGPMTMGGEWDARAKEMGFDFRKQVRQLEGGEWAGTGQGADHFNQLFEEAGGVLDRPEHGAAARYGEGFTDWLGGQGYQVYTEPQQEWMTQGQQGLGALGQQQDMSWYTPHLSQYAMTGEEMKDPTGTLKTRMANLYQPSGNDVGGLPPGLEGLRGGKLNPNMNITQLPDWQQQQGTLGGFGSRKQPPADLTRALQAGVGSLQGPTQQKIKEGYMT